MQNNTHLILNGEVSRKSSFKSNLQIYFQAERKLFADKFPYYSLGYFMNFRDNELTSCFLSENEKIISNLMDLNKHDCGYEYFMYLQNNIFKLSDSQLNEILPIVTDVVLIELNVYNSILSLNADDAVVNSFKEKFINNLIIVAKGAIHHSDDEDCIIYKKGRF